jgi:hypothetical protein
MYIYRSDEMATKGSDSSKYQSPTCSLLNLSSLALSTSVIVPTSYNQHLKPSLRCSLLAIYSCLAEINTLLH